MKKILKTTTILLLTVAIMISLFTVNVFAAGTSSIAFSKNELNLGDTLTVTVRFNATEKTYGVQGYLKYDPKIFELASESSSITNMTSGLVKVVLGSEEKTSVAVDISFKAKAAGKGIFSVVDSVYVDGNLTEQEISDSGATAQVKDKSASKSSNANLSYLRLSAGTLSPNFSANTTTYNVTVPNSVTEVLLYIGAEDKNARTDVEGSKTMKVGKNTRKVIVTAENGTVKTYTLNITRLAADGTSSENTSSTETDTPSEDEKIIVDGVEKYIAEDFSQELIYEGFALTTYNFHDKEYPAITDGGTTLIYLVDEKGENGAFYRIDKQNNITKFKFITVGKNMYQLLVPTEAEVNDDYKVTIVTIGEEEFEAYQKVTDENTEFVYFFAKYLNHTGLYRYDTVENTMQRADGMTTTVTNTEPEPDDTKPSGNVVENFKNLTSNGKIVAITAVAILLLLLAAIIILLVKVFSSKKEYDEEDDYYDEEEQEKLFEFNSINVSDNNKE